MQHLQYAKPWARPWGYNEEFKNPTVEELRFHKGKKQVNKYLKYSEDYAAI